MIVMLSALVLAAMQTAEAVQVEASLVSGQCVVEVAGRRLTEDEFAQTASGWARDRREVHVKAIGDAPYRCIGGAIFAIQKAGVNRVGFISEPDPAHATLAIEPRCRIYVDGRRIGLTGLRNMIPAWIKTRPQIELVLDPEVRYPCVDRVLKILKRAPISLGFVGNGPAE